MLASSTPQISNCSDADHASKFRMFAESLVELALREGVRVRPFESPELRHFSRLQLEEQRKVLERLRIYVDLCASVVSEGGLLRDSPLLVMKMIKKLGLTSRAEILDKIKADSIVEIYTPDNIQIFRNLRFFEICSYTLEDIMCREWWKLYWREDVFTREIFLCASRMFNGEINTTISPPIPRHVLKEKESMFQIGVEMQIDYLSPLYQDGRTQALVSIQSGQIFESLAPYMHF